MPANSIDEALELIHPMLNKLVLIATFLEKKMRIEYIGIQKKWITQVVVYDKFLIFRDLDSSQSSTLR